jgi:hypothetical protein
MRLIKRTKTSFGGGILKHKNINIIRHIRNIKNDKIVIPKNTLECVFKKLRNNIKI